MTMRTTLLVLLLLQSLPHLAHAWAASATVPQSSDCYAIAIEIFTAAVPDYPKLNCIPMNGFYKYYNGGDGGIYNSDTGYPQDFFLNVTLGAETNCADGITPDSCNITINGSEQCNECSIKNGLVTLVDCSNVNSLPGDLDYIPTPQTFRPSSISAGITDDFYLKLGTSEERCNHPVYHPPDCAAYRGSIAPIDAPVLTFNYFVNVGSGLFQGQVIYEGHGWVGFAVSRDGNMLGSHAVIGSEDTHFKFYKHARYTLAGYSTDLVTEGENVKGEFVQNNTHTVLSFLVTLKDPTDSDFDINVDGSNNFLLAAGSSNTLGYHAHRASIEVDLSGCYADNTNAPSTESTAYPTGMQSLSVGTESPSDDHRETMGPTHAVATASPSASPTQTTNIQAPATMTYTFFPGTGVELDHELLAQLLHRTVDFFHTTLSADSQFDQEIGVTLDNISTDYAPTMEHLTLSMDITVAVDPTSSATLREALVLLSKADWNHFIADYVRRQRSMSEETSALTNIHKVFFRGVGHGSH